MRAFVIGLVFIAVPIYLAAAMFGRSDHDFGGFSSLALMRERVAASDFAHDALAELHRYAASHPRLVASLKAHRGALKELRSRLCSAIEC